MNKSRIITDGLWRCLRPSIDPIASHRLRTPLLNHGRGGPSPVGRKQLAFLEQVTWGRFYSVLGPRQEDSLKSGWEDEGSLAQIDLQARALTDCESTKAITDEELWPLPVPTLHKMIRAIRNQTSSFLKTATFVEHLLRHRGETLDAWHYDTIIRGLADPCGSAEALGNLLEEMKQLQIPCRGEIYHNALSVLAMHPDYVLRGKVVREMRAAWVDTETEDMCYIALGLLRDGQDELAFDKLEEMVQEGIQVPHWVYDIFIFEFSKRGFLEEAVNLLQRRTKPDQPEVHTNILYYLLDACSAAHDYDGTKYLWGLAITVAKLNPSDVMALNVANTAAGHGDAPLALEAVQLMADRTSRMGKHHFEPLIACYARAQDFEQAIRVLLMMERLGLDPTPTSTRSLYRCLRSQPGLIQQYAETAHKLSPIPICAVEVAIEALCTSTMLDVDAALGLYRNIHRMSPDGPSSDTFRYLLDAVEVPRTVNFLATEADAFVADLTLPLRLLDKVVHNATVMGNIDLAFRYLKRMDQSPSPTPSQESCQDPRDPWQVHRETVMALFHRCVSERDERAWQLMTEADKRCPDIAAAMKSAIEQSWSERQLNQRSETRIDVTAFPKECGNQGNTGKSL